MRQYLPMLKKCILFDSIDEENFEQAVADLKISVKHYEKNQVVRYHETKVAEIGIILKGIAYITKFDVFGNRMILIELNEGQTFGESLSFVDAINSPISVVSAGDSAVAFVPIENVIKTFSSTAAYSRQMMLNLISLMARKNLNLQIKIDILAQKTTREKLLLYFEYESKTANNKTFNIHFSREELADFLCLNSNALSRELSKMCDDGLLVFKKNKFSLKT